MLHNHQSQLITLQTRQVGTDWVETVDARDLHRFLEVGKDFSTWSNDRIKQFDFAKNQDFIIFPEIGEKSGRGRPAKEYALTLDMAKELSMVERNAKGKQARQYFIECEKRLRAGQITTCQDDNRPRLKFPHLLHGFYRGATLARITSMERKLVGQGVHDFGLDPEQARTRALGIIQNHFGADPAFLFHGLPIIVPNDLKVVTHRKSKSVAPATESSQTPPEIEQVDHNVAGPAPVMGFVPYLTATQIAEQLNLRFSTDRPNGHAVNDLICAMGLAYRLADNRILPTPEGEKICHRRPALDAQNQPIKGYETLTWDARLVDRMRAFVKNHPSQMPLF